MKRYIDADALISLITARYCFNCDKRKGIKKGKLRFIYDIGDAPCRACSVDDMKSEIDDAPTADVIECKNGVWIAHHTEKGKAYPFYTCSECGAFVGLNISNFCPECGAKMRN